MLSSNPWAIQSGCLVYVSVSWRGEDGTGLTEEEKECEMDPAHNPSYYPSLLFPAVQTSTTPRHVAWCVQVCLQPPIILKPAEADPAILQQRNKKKVVPSATSLDGLPHHRYVLVPAHRLEIFSSLACRCLEVHCPVSPVTSVCTTSPSA